MTTFLNVLKIIGYVAVGFLVYQVLLRFVRRNWHFPAPAFISVFLNSRLRGRMQDPHQVLQRSDVQPEQKVLEIGCGGGFFLPYAAELVGEHGRVFGLDIAPDMLDRCRKYLNRWPEELTKRIELVQKSAYELPFEDNSLDLVYLVAALMEIPDPKRCLLEVRRVLKPDGILAVSELLPDPDYPTAKVTIKCCEAAGFTVEDVKGNLWTYTAKFKRTGK
jgi:ubiquinone/menaquinone biosynthesis C-methylase UbiE